MEESEKDALKFDIQKMIMASSLITSWQIDGETMETVRLYFGRLQNHCRWWCSHEIKRHFLLGRKTMVNRDSMLKSRGITLLTKVHLVKAMVFPVVIYGYENWTINKAEWGELSFWTVVLEKTLESPLDCKVIQPVNPKGNQPWVFIGRTDDVEAETPILWPPHVKSWLTGKDPDGGKDWGQE